MLWQDKWVSEKIQAFDLPRQKSLDRSVKGLIRRRAASTLSSSRSSRFLRSQLTPPSHLGHGKALRQSIRGPRGRMGLRSFTWRPFLKGPATDTTMAHKWPFVASSSAPRSRAVTNALSTLALALRPPTSSVPPLLLVRSFTLTNDRSRGECCV